MRIMTEPKALTVNGHDISEAVLSAIVEHFPGNLAVVQITVFADAVRINGVPAAVAPPCKLQYCVRQEPHTHDSSWLE